jgi:membrane-bound serine protease (ClpP class)
MRLSVNRLAVAACAAVLLLGAKPASQAEAPAAEKPIVDVATVEIAIQPISAEYIVQRIDQAERDKREALVILLDTPGGLDTSMRQIIKRILVSEVPVVVYVAPAGSRAASAGTFIAYAAHVAAMAPGTSIGAATPVNMGGADIQKDLARKVKNDAVSYIRSLAAQRGRNADWAEKAVREGGSLPEDQALKLHVVDYVARDLDDLLRQMDGRKVVVAGVTRTLHTSGAVHHIVPPSLRQRLLGRIVDPNVSYILFILGFYGLIFELSNPGAILPGIVGGICILVALLSFQALPVDMTGVFLIFFAMLLFLVEVKVQSHGLLSLGGVVSLVLGSLILMSGGRGEMRLSLPVVLTVAVVTVLFFGFVVGAGYRALKRKPITGREGLVGERGVALTDLPSRGGRIFVHGEDWAAEADERIEKGAPVIVDQVDGMRLRVHKA